MLKNSDRRGGEASRRRWGKPGNSWEEVLTAGGDVDLDGASPSDYSDQALTGHDVIVGRGGAGLWRGKRPGRHPS